ncbi:MAG: twin-arginine translocase subunit TatC [Isosphaeraceae bacterium]|nr:twin-arginine translocase subunit TatC [Isosphaeraceae bacterium]
MPTERDLFEEEQQMVAMSFGDHIEELRMRLILALMGLVVGVIITFIPPLNLGARIVRKMQEPADEALRKYQLERAKKRAEVAKEANSYTPAIAFKIPADSFVRQLHELAPDLKLPPPEAVKGKVIELPQQIAEAGLIEAIATNTESKSATISLSPMEPAIIFFMVCLVAGLVLASPWVFYQIWAFVAAGLYRHERYYVKKFLPFSLGLFLTGVFLCFFIILPVTLRVLLEFNAWLDIEPSLRISDWMSFATLLPLVFGLCFQTPLVMYFLERLGIFTAQDYREKRKYAILVIVIIAAVLTPDPTIVSQSMLAIPMILLYELGIFLVRPKKEAAAAVAG